MTTDDILTLTHAPMILNIILIFLLDPEKVAPIIKIHTRQAWGVQGPPYAQFYKSENLVVYFSMFMVVGFPKTLRT